MNLLQLTQHIVKTAFDFLIAAHGKTSTLVVKLHLRDQGYEARQQEVHDFVEEIFNNNPDQYDREMYNGQYFEYVAKVPASVQAAGAQINDDDNSTSTNNSTSQPAATSTTATAAPTADPTGQLMKTNTTLLGDRVPKFELAQDQVKSLEQYPHRNDWVVNKRTMDKDDKFYIFDGGMSSDLVRSRVASINKVKSADIRAARVSYRFPAVAAN